MSEQEKGFTVKDRRHFQQDEQPNAEAQGAASPPPKDDGEPAASAATQEKARPPLPEINFPTFVASLNASALVHLGVIEDPVSGNREKDLEMAKQTIDILTMLQQKTAGNLNPDEESMLKSILYDLRMLYVKEKA